jgi:16S rRNA processing protein RimM
VLVIQSESGEVLIPFVRVLVPVVDIAGKRLTVIPPIVDGQMS